VVQFSDRLHPPPPLFPELFILKGLRSLLFDNFGTVHFKGLAVWPVIESNLGVRRPQKQKSGWLSKELPLTSGAVLNEDSMHDLPTYCKLKITDLLTY
jgi:hypothetical protein